MSKPVERILLTNDDGIDAQGLKFAYKIARQLSDDVWVVAPLFEQSGASHSLTLSSPMRLFQRSSQRFAVDGTPTDCVMIATRHLMREKPPSLVLSGINFGFNIAEDVSYSGTVAGAKEGTVFGIPSIAMSQALTINRKVAIPKPVARFSIAEKYAPAIIEKLCGAGWSANTLININFPAIGIDDECRVRITTQGKRDAGMFEIDARTDPRGRPYFWYDANRTVLDAAAGTDIAAIRDGDISVTPLKIDHTNTEMQSTLHKLLNQQKK